MKKTLIIHPQDQSTDFLKGIYKRMKLATVVTGEKSKSTLKKLIKEHDRIMMMGHGWSNGLFNTRSANFKTGGLVIDKEYVELLKEKECIFIWCQAHDFVKENELKGFNTGMFISEVGEATWFDIYTTQKIVDESNYEFVKIFKQHRTENPKMILKHVRTKYKKLGETNPIAEYNSKLLYNGKKD